MFAVVTCPGYNTVDVVASKWLVDDGKKRLCHFPSVVGDKLKDAVKKAGITGEEPGRAWKLYEAKVKGKFGEYLLLLPD